MGPETVNRNKASNFYGPYAGRDLYITMYQDSEREFIVTHNADIKPTVYFIGRETELEDLRRRTEEGRKSVLISGMGGIGKTQICRKLFEEYSKNDKNGPFSHIGYIEYDGDMNNSLQRCLKYKEQERQEDNLEAAWRELEYLASDGKLLLLVDNVNKPISADPGLQRLKEIPGAVVLTSRRTSFSKEFEPYRIGFLDMEQCKEIYRFIRYEGSKEKVPEEEIPDLEYIIDTQAAGHTLTIEFLAHLARTKLWTTKDLRDQLTGKGFQLEYKDDEDKLVNIQKSYETLYDLSELTEAEQNILEAFSVFPYIPLPAKTCNEWLLADARVNENEDVLVGLYRKGWLQFDIKQESYAMHPVFAKFIYEKSKPKEENHSNLIEEVQRIFEMLKDDPKEEFYFYVSFCIYFCDKMSVGKNKRLFKLRMTCRRITEELEEKDRRLKEERRRLKEELRQAEEKTRQVEEKIRQAKEELWQEAERLKLADRAVEDLEYEEPYLYYFKLILDITENFHGSKIDLVRIHFLSAWLDEVGGITHSERCLEPSVTELGEIIWLL